MFLLSIHIPKCQIRQDYFNKMLEPSAMEEIKRRVDGSIYKVEIIETKTFQGKALEKEEVDKRRFDL
jgi:hypothetical protein